MNITDLDECLSELPEINVRELFRPRSPASGSFSWMLEKHIDRLVRDEPNCSNAA